MMPAELLLPRRLSRLHLVWHNREKLFLGSHKERRMSDQVDMRQLARGIGVTKFFKAGSIVFHQGDPGGTLYVVQSGIVEMTIGDKVIEVVTENGAIGLLSVVDDAAMSATATVREDAELTLVDKRRFSFMVDELPNFPMYLLRVLTRRIRSMGQIIG